MARRGEPSPVAVRTAAFRALFRFNRAHSADRGRLRRISAPDRLFRPAEGGEFPGSQRSLTRGEKLVELRRANRSPAQHGVSLSPVMDLMLEQVQQKPVQPLMLDMGFTVHGDDSFE